MVIRKRSAGTVETRLLIIQCVARIVVLSTPSAMAGIQPSPAQAQNIREKTEAVFRLFRPVHPVVAVSARTGWELDTLVSALMTALPDHAASPLMTRLQDELRTESVRAQAREQFTGAVDRIFDTAESVCVASVARTVLRAVRDTVVSVARAVWNWIFF